MLRTTTGRYIDRLLEYLQEFSSDYEYFVCLDQKGFDSWEPRNGRFKKVLSPFAAYSLDEQTKFLLQLFRLKPDLVHFTMPQQPFLYFGRSVTTVHDLTLIRHSNSLSNSIAYKLKMSLFSGLLKLIAKRAAEIIANSFYTRDDFANLVGMDREKVSVTYLAADYLSASAVEKNELSGKKFLLYVGNAYPYKNLSLLVAAHRALLDSGRDLHLVLAGKTDQYHAAVREGLTESQAPYVHFTGYVTDGQLHWLYRNAVAYVFPSLSEGFGLPGVEAMLHGLPVLSSRATALPEIFSDSALYFDPTSVDDLCACVVRILGDEDLRLRLISAGYERAAAFSWQTMAMQTKAIYDRCLSRCPSGYA